MPYCIQQESDGKFVLLNGDYKPIGFNIKRPCDYDEYQMQFYLKVLTRVGAAEIHKNDRPTSAYE